MGVAVNVTLVPAQIVVVDAAIEMDGVRMGFTTIVMLLLVAMADVTHVAELVRIQVTTSLLLSVVEVNVELFAPMFVPLIFH